LISLSLGFGIQVASAPRMSQPRQILPRSTYLVTRRSLRRHYLLRPEYFVNNLFVFLLAVLAAKYSIAIHAFCVMSSHEHLIVTDTLGKLPDFLRDFHRLTALALKVLRKWEGSVWDSDQVSVVHLKTPEATVEKIAYVMANPTAVGAVRYAADWPGLVTTPKNIGKGTWTAKRPKAYFDQDNDRNRSRGFCSSGTATANSSRKTFVRPRSDSSCTWSTILVGPSGASVLRAT
jgi:putative transposase